LRNACINRGAKYVPYWQCGPSIEDGNRDCLVEDRSLFSRIKLNLGDLAKGEVNEDFDNVSKNRWLFQPTLGHSLGVPGSGFVPRIVGSGQQCVEYPRKWGRPFP
jgi:hypothetical protein